MKFDDLDAMMRVYERSIDQCILPDMYIVARLDGRSFTRLTKEICSFEAPFDVRFRDLMTDTVKELFGCGSRIIYGYTESDEISLLFHPDDNSFGRKVRKINTTLAGEASAVFSLALGQRATFDCRVVPLPNMKRVTDYFSWRMEDSHRNSLNAHCYWLLRKEGMSVAEATAALSGKSISYKNELLFERGINYNDLPSWQKRGIGIYPKKVIKTGYDPHKDIPVEYERRELYTDLELPLRDQYRAFIEDILRRADEE
ncbi:MAG: guanylyltransferase [Oscillospiraceae bacterium]|nr:guanylyltransferase [Oscillospiraceae bacterium]